MELIKIESRCKQDINAILRCEFCGKQEMVYGYDNDEWYNGIKDIKCSSCYKSTVIPNLNKE